ncbi:MAG TPA: polyprenyl synthetase family protein [Pseudomonadales bacterium]
MMQDIRNLVSQDFAAVNNRILEQLHSHVPLVEDVGHHITEAGGKRLRPLLTLLAANALSCQDKRYIDLAVIIEFIHTATLLHDDVVDLSTLRRGLPTANARWGNAPSILVGDFMYSRAFQMLVALGSMDIMALLSDTTNQIAEGEVFQLTKAGDPDTSRDDYLRIIRDKTAILFAAALKSAALIANAGPEQTDALYRYGLHLGIAFQLADDVLDYQGDSQAMGKNIGDDLSEGKPTLPLIYSIENSHHGEADVIIEAIRNKDASRLDDVILLIRRNGALEHTLDVARHEAAMAKQVLGCLPDNRFRQGLCDLADFALKRNH